MTDIDNLVVTVWFDDAEGMYNATIQGASSVVHKSRYALWAKAHALTWYANQLYAIKVLSSRVDDFREE